MDCSGLGNTIFTGHPACKDVLASNNKVTFMEFSTPENKRIELEDSEIKRFKVIAKELH